MTPQQTTQIWVLLCQTWGAKFADQYGAEPNEAWSAALMLVSLDNAKAALRELILSGSPFPPTLPEFLASARKHRQAQAKAMMAEVEALPPMDPEKARDNIIRLRKTLRGVLDR